MFPAQDIARALVQGIVFSERYKVPFSSLQPASLDLRLGETAYRLRCSFLPGDEPVEARLADYVIGKPVDLRDGAILERNCPYLIPLMEELRLPDGVFAKANPKSSTGRVDVFTRVITDKSHKFDEVAPGYRGKLFLEVVPQSFTVRVKTGLALNQLRLATHAEPVSDGELLNRHDREPLLFDDAERIEAAAFALALSEGLFLSLDLGKRKGQQVGFKAKQNSRLLDLTQVNHHDPADYWEPIVAESPGRVVLEPGAFYLLLSREAVRIPPMYAAEMTAFDPTAGELRTHYAGFFDPGFGQSAPDTPQGSRAALEVRAHDVPFMIENGQRFCKLSFERMAALPAMLYGETIGSNYQHQRVTLSKHFRFERPAASAQLVLPVIGKPTFSWEGVVETATPSDLLQRPIDVEPELLDLACAEAPESERDAVDVHTSMSDASGGEAG